MRNINIIMRCVLYIIRKHYFGSRVIRVTKRLHAYKHATIHEIGILRRQWITRKRISNDTLRIQMCFRHGNIHT